MNSIFYANDLSSQKKDIPNHFWLLLWFIKIRCELKNNHHLQLETNNGTIIRQKNDKNEMRKEGKKKMRKTRKKIVYSRKEGTKKYGDLECTYVYLF